MGSTKMNNSDDLKYFIRIRGRKKQFIEFDFAIGSPDLAVEMIMPRILFEEFCQRYQATVISDDDGILIDSERAIWRHGSSEPLSRF